MSANPDLRPVVSVVHALAEAIRELKEVPSGHLYAGLMGRVTLSDYNALIAILKRANIVSEDGKNMLRWTGPNY